MSQSPAKYSVLNFFLLTFALSWLCWVPLVQLGIPSEPLALVMGTFGPTISALLLTGLRGGWNGLRKLLEKLFIWRVKFHWYLFSLGVSAVVVTLALWVHRWLGGDSYPGQ